MLRWLLTDRENVLDTALIENDRPIPYGYLMDRAYALGAHLQGMAGENIALLLGDGADFISAFYGILLSGKVAFPINPAMTKGEIVALMKSAHSGTVVTSYIHSKALEGIEEGIRILYMEDLLPIAHKPHLPERSPDETAVLLATSGTTGDSKIVMLSGRNIMTSVHGQLDRLDISGTARIALASPFSSAYGIMIVSACLLRSFPIIVSGVDFTLSGLFLLIERHRVTHFEGSTTAVQMLERLSGKEIPYDVSSLIEFGFGGSKISGESIDRARKALPGVSFREGYGMTEASPLLAKHPRGDVTKVDSVGKATRGVELAVETEGGITRAPYTTGEIVAQGDNIMLGYYENPSATRAALRGGYLHTGDIGHLDEEGYLYITGRAKNIIIVRGFNVYPEEVEECIRQSGLADDCVVYGVNDAAMGEMVCADVVPADKDVTEEALIAHCGERLAVYKLPKRITFCDSIARNASGKILRAVL